MTSLEEARTQLKLLIIKQTGAKVGVLPVAKLSRIHNLLEKAIRDTAKASALNAASSPCCGKPDACTRTGAPGATEPGTCALRSQSSRSSFSAKPTLPDYLKGIKLRTRPKTRKPGGQSSGSKKER